MQLVGRNVASSLSWRFKTNEVQLNLPLEGHKDFSWVCSSLENRRSENRLALCFSTPLGSISNERDTPTSRRCVDVHEATKMMNICGEENPRSQPIAPSTGAKPRKSTSPDSVIWRRKIRPGTKEHRCAAFNGAGKVRGNLGSNFVFVTESPSA